MPAFDPATAAMFIVVAAAGAAIAFVARGTSSWPLTPFLGSKPVPATPAYAVAALLLRAAADVKAAEIAVAKESSNGGGGNSSSPTASSEARSPLLPPRRAANRPPAYRPAFDALHEARATELLKELQAQEATTSPKGIAASTQLQLLKRATAGFRAVSERRATAFDVEGDNEVDVALLKELWHNAGLPEPFERTSEHWSKLGFQGLDPATDLRGGGMHALDQFLALSRMEPGFLKEMIDYNRDTYAAGSMAWFLPAVVSIQFSAQVALGEIALPMPHLAFVLADGAGVRRGLDRLHVLLMRHFFTIWKAEKPSVMEFTQFVKPKVLDTFFTPSWQPPKASAFEDA